MFGPLINTVTRGARLKKFYLRSAATGVGKTRAMIADACSIACDEIYDLNEKKWINNGTKEPTIFISTEQEIDEIQTMMYAFLSNVDEEHIITGEYLVGEWERVVYAAKLLERCPLYIQQLPDFSLQDIENTIKKGIRDYDVKYVCFDYIHTSMKILSEVSSKTGVKGLREDNILFMISIRLKDLCNQYGIFILTATQLNADYVTAQQYDQNLLRGAKAIADKIDCGMIMLEVSQEDITALEPLLKKEGFETPVIKISVYKNRRGRYKSVLLWCKANRGTCRIEPMFMTNYQYQFMPIEDLKIKVKPKQEESAF
jgi:replicative DNA helicase